MSGILSLFSHFLKIQDFFAIHCNNNFCITLSYLFYYKAETGKKTAWVLANLPQATKKKSLRSKESCFTFQNEMPWKTVRGRGSQTLSFVLFGLFFCIFSQYFCALFVIVPWMNWMCGSFNGKVTLSVCESKKKKKTTTSYSWFWKWKIDKLSFKVIQSLRKLYFRPLDVFLKSGGRISV